MKTILIMTLMFLITSCKTNPVDEDSFPKTKKPLMHSFPRYPL